MKHDVLICIPTRGRCGEGKQLSLSQFLKYSSYKPMIICPKGEVKEHRKYYKRVRGCPVLGIGKTRQWILENFSDEYIVMCDDDMNFVYREDPKSIKLSECKRLDSLVDKMVRCLDLGFIHGGLGPRQRNNLIDCSSARAGQFDKKLDIVYKDCDRVNNLHFMNRRKVLDAGARMDALPVMEDFHFTLTLLIQGYPNRVIHSYAWRQRASGESGGCSLYRTDKVQAKGAEGLKKAFPDFVKVVTKKSKSTSNYWKDFKERKDVIVQWLKAARSGGIDI